MGYTTEFYGEISIEPPLNQQEIEFLEKFNNTRRMKRKKGPYYVDGTGYAGQDHEPDIIDYNEPPEEQPNLWCQWTPNKDGSAIEWDEGEKFYDAAEWMQYLIDHFVGSSPLAKQELPFLQPHVLNGEIEAKGDDRDDHWLLIVGNNLVSTKQGRVVYDE